MPEPVPISRIAAPGGSGSSRQLGDDRIGEAVAVGSEEHRVGRVRRKRGVDVERRPDARDAQVAAPQVPDSVDRAGGFQVALDLGRQQARRERQAPAEHVGKAARLPAARR